MKYVSSYPQSGAIAVGASGVINILSNTGIPITKNGFLYIWVSNETPNWYVYFDNLKVVQYAGPLLEENHYYPFGLTMAAISSKALKPFYAENKYRYNDKELQNKEFSDGTGLEEYDYQARMYDPQIGRWMVVDDLASKFLKWSPYTYGDDDPINNVDPNGRFSINNHYNYTNNALTNLGFSKRTSDLVAHYSSVYADHPSSKVMFFEGASYRKGIDYGKTANSQDSKSIENSTWHSMKADGEKLSDEDATARGQAFGWSQIIEASSEIRKVGGIENLKENSAGIQELGQGIHALQDAIAHKGTDLAHHDLYNDMYPSAGDAAKAQSAATNGVIVSEVLAGDYTHAKNGMTIDLTGTTSEQYKQVISAFINAANSSKEDDYKIYFTKDKDKKAK